MTLADKDFDRDGIRCDEALFLYVGKDDMHAMAYVRLFEDDWNDATGLCWWYTSYVFEDGCWHEYGDDGYWDCDNADEFVPYEADLPYDLLGFTPDVYMYPGAGRLFEELLKTPRDFGPDDIARGERSS